jgi:hypothetical protein
MARSTLPEFDPLAQLGIGQPPAATANERPARRSPRPAAPRKPEEATDGISELPSVEPTGAPTHGGEVAVQEPPVSQPATAAEARTAAARTRPQLTLAPNAQAAPGLAKAKTSGRIAADVLEEVRDCVVWHGHAMTIDSFTESAFREHLKRLRKQHGLGDRFPAREREPKQGRRVC